LTAPLAAYLAPEIPVETRARSAQRVVVGTVVQQSPRFHTNEFGDRLIVTDVMVRVDETLKGAPVDLVDVVIEGGTIGTLTLEVSDMPVFKGNERAVLFLDAAAGGFVPHRRGLGILKLDRGEQVEGTTLTLADVRRAVRSVAR
jgi:hypothetical protein